MTLQEILALRPATDDSATIRAAIARAKEAQENALAEAAELERAASAALLSSSDEEILEMERKASVARLTADRIDRLLPEIEALLPAAEKRESLEETKAIAIEYRDKAHAFFEKWDENYMPAALVIRGLLMEWRSLEKYRPAVQQQIEQIRKRRDDWKFGENSGIDLPRFWDRFTETIAPSSGVKLFPPDLIQLPGIDAKSPILWTRGGQNYHLVPLPKLPGVGDAP